MVEPVYIMNRRGEPVRCPEGYPYGFCLLGRFPSRIGEMRAWCKQQFGRGNGYRRWQYEDGRVFFRFADDAFAFKMRWL